jgi:undecaprenyl-diphosphatase
MDPVLAFLVGMLQGITEWLPISSSGHVLLMLEGLDVPSDDALAFAFFLHFGTLFAVVVRLRGDVRDVVVALPRWRTDPLVRFLLVATLVSLPVGFLLVQGLESLFTDAAGGLLVSVLVGVMLILTGFTLRAAKDRAGSRRVEDTGTYDAVILGLVQGLAALPGISRSGMTVSALLIHRMDADESLRLSFLMSVPVTIAVVLYEVVTWDMGSLGWDVVLAGVVGSFALGYLTIEGLMAVSRRVRWDLFCIIFGAIAMALGSVLMVVD